MREGACAGDATMLHPSMLRLIRNAAALAAASPTLLFSDWKNAARLNRNALSDWWFCDGSPVALTCAAVSLWACRKRRRKNSPCMREEVLTMAGRKEMF